jgi:ribose/xylose/arabinose/galactoside ABC-type transport system permease subunit
MNGLKNNITLAEQNYNRALFYRRYGIGLVMIGMVIILSFTTKFLQTRNILNVLSTVAINGALACGTVFVITAGGIDLSVGSMLAWGSIVVGLILKHVGNIPLASVAAIVSCAFFGLINGFLIAKFDLFPFVATLAMQLVIRGLATALAGGYSFPIAVPSFTKVGLGKFLNVIPYPAIILVILVIISYFLLHWTKFGRYVYAVGGNRNAAEAAGVNVFWTRVFTFIYSGVCAGVASLLITARINASQPNIGVGYETDAIAACVIGGTSFAGGIATIPGTAMGIIIIGLIYNGMNLLGVESYWQTVCKGLLIVGAVLLDKFVNRKK